jgi:GNAT superfamily N-acetyltransferase
VQFKLHALRLPAVPVPTIYSHEVDTGEMWLAELAGEAVGFAGLITRSGIGFLSEFFVDPRHQSAGVGRALLSRVLSSGARRYCTLSSTDPRALALYVRAGLHPQWPHFLLTGAAHRLEPIDASGARIQAARPDDPSLVEWDARIGGRRRPEDHGFWRSDLGALPIWVERAGRAVGYGYVRPRPPRAGEPASVVIGPIGSEAPADAAACVAAAVEWGRAHGEVIHAAVPGPHPALPALLAAGFRITYVETFAASSIDAFCDPRTYMPAAGLEGSTLF